MLQQPLYSLFIRLIPETFIVMYAICLLTKSDANFKNIFISAIIGGICVYLTRMLPIHFGVHTILSIMLIIVLAIKLNNIEIQKAITASLTSVILLFISDMMLVVFYNFINFTSALSGQTLVSVVAGVPSLVLFYFIVKAIICVKDMRVKNEQY